MKILILFALVTIASADVSHILQEDGYHYQVPSKPFPSQPLVVDIPVQQNYLPPPQTIITPKPIVPIVPIQPVLPILTVQPSPPKISFIQKPSNVQPHYLPPVQKVTTFQPVNIPKPLPATAQVIIPRPQPTIRQPVVIPHPVAPVRDYLPPTPVIKQLVPQIVQQPAVVYEPKPVVQIQHSIVQKPVVQVQKPVQIYQPTPAPIVYTTPSVQIIERPQLLYQPQLSQRFEDDHSGSQSVNVQKSGYVYNNNPQPPFSF